MAVKRSNVDGMTHSCNKGKETCLQILLYVFKVSDIFFGPLLVKECGGVYLTEQNIVCYPVVRNSAHVYP